jgi:phosphatidylethanolamine/phosphatidyl-N-methylethanolamine N-methyltransferase
VGIDISAPMIKRAQKKATRLNSGNRYEFHVMDACNLDFPDNSFDVVMAAYVITTVCDPHRVCREMLRVVKPGGTDHCGQSQPLPKRQPSGQD